MWSLRCGRAIRTVRVSWISVDPVWWPFIGSMPFMMILQSNPTLIMTYFTVRAYISSNVGSFHLFPFTHSTLELPHIPDSSLSPHPLKMASWYAFMFDFLGLQSLSGNGQTIKSSFPNFRIIERSRTKLLGGSLKCHVNYPSRAKRGLMVYGVRILWFDGGNLRTGSTNHGQTFRKWWGQ